MPRFIRRLRSFSSRLVQGFILLARRRPIGFSFIFITLLIVFLIGSLWEIEPDHDNPIWRAMVYLISGMDVDPPYTWQGKIIASFLLISGVIGVSMFTGYIAAKFSRFVSSSQYIPHKPLDEEFSNHIIIFGWGEKTRAILRELNECYRNIGVWAKKIIILSPDQLLLKANLPIYDHVWHVCGSATDETILRAANLHNANGQGAHIAAILSASDVNSDQADRESLLVALAVEHLHPPVLSLAELKKQENIAHFRNACVDQVFVPDSYASLLLAKTAAFPGIAGFVEDLLSLKPKALNNPLKTHIGLTRHSANELNIVGLDFTAAILKCYQQANILLLGKLTNNRYLLYPDILSSHSTSLTEDDLVIAIKPQKS